MSWRTDNTRLPGSDELDNILSREEFRPVAQGKEGVHYPDFATIVALLKHLGLPSELFLSPIDSIHTAVARGDVLMAELVEQRTELILNAEGTELLDACYDYLAEADEPEPSDLIFVFGGKTPARPILAADLYQRELAAQILVSGGNAIYAQDRATTEADIYAGIMLDAGVPPDAIIRETKSITVPDNIRVSLNLLDSMGQSVSSLILVNSPYTQRRGWAIFRKHLPDDVRLYRLNCDTKPEFSRGQWYKQEATFRVVVSEFMKMRASVVYNTA